MLLKMHSKGVHSQAPHTEKVPVQHSNTVSMVHNCMLSIPISIVIISRFAMVGWCLRALLWNNLALPRIELSKSRYIPTVGAAFSLTDAISLRTSSWMCEIQVGLSLAEATRLAFHMF